MHTRIMFGLAIIAGLAYWGEAFDVSSNTKTDGTEEGVRLLKRAGLPKKHMSSGQQCLRTKVNFYRASGTYRDGIENAAAFFCVCMRNYAEKEFVNEAEEVLLTAETAFSLKKADQNKVEYLGSIMQKLGQNYSQAEFEYNAQRATQVMKFCAKKLRKKFSS